MNTTTLTGLAALLLALPLATFTAIAAPAAAGGAPHFVCDFVPLYPIWARM